MSAIEQKAQEIFEAVAGFIGRALEPRDERIKALESRIASLEERPSIQYRGVWDADTEYKAGDFVTRHGSMFAALRSTKTEPPGNDWRLAVQRGRDAR